MGTVMAAPPSTDPRMPSAGAVAPGCALLGSDGGWAVVDEALCALLGRTREQLTAAPVGDVFNPADLAREKVHLEQLLAGGLLTFRSEARLLHSDGSAIWALLDATAIHDQAGEARCLLQLQDISARKRLETLGTGWALADDALDDPAVLVTVKSADGAFQRVNDRFAELFSVNDERLRGRRDDYLFPHAIAASLREKDLEALAEPSGRLDAEDAVPQPEGDRALVSARIVLAGASGLPNGLVWIAAEPADRERLEAMAARLFEAEQQARRRAAAERAALLENERSSRAIAAESRARLLERAAALGIEGMPAEEEPAGEVEAAEHLELVAAERAARAEVERLRDELAVRRQSTEREQARRSEASAEIDRLRIVVRTKEAELVKARSAQEKAEAEAERMRAVHRERQEMLEGERAARASAEAEVERLRSAERAAGARVPLPALVTDHGSAEFNGNGHGEGSGPDPVAAWRVEGQARLTWALAEATAPHEGAREALRIVGETMGWAAGGCYTADGAGTAARCCAFWQAGGVQADELETASWHVSFEPGEGPVGRVLESGQAQWTHDAGSDPQFMRHAQAAAAGAGTVLVAPITSRDETLGALEMFASGDMRPDDAVASVLAEVGLQLGQFFMRNEAESLRSRYGRVGR